MIFKATLLKAQSARLFFLFTALAVNLTGASCTPDDEKAQPKLPTADLIIRAGDGQEHQIRAEIARSDTEKSKGLMFRTSLKDGEGMLFVEEGDRILSFWMKNTLIPLSIAYISSVGVITEIHDLKPGQLNPVRSTRSLRYALELPHGWFERSGVAAGDRVTIPDSARSGGGR